MYIYVRDDVGAVIFTSDANLDYGHIDTLALKHVEHHASEKLEVGRMVEIVVFRLKYLIQ